MTQPLHVAFVWHMHQPYYKDLVTGQYVLPWVRLHGTKDYYDMVHILGNYPNVRQTVNCVPSLMVQIRDYAEGKAEDRYIDLTLKDPGHMTPPEKVELLTTFFYANHETMIEPHPRYADLLRKRGVGDEEERLLRVARYFTEQDLIDLQVWFNLAWCDPVFRTGDPVIRKLYDKGRDFTHEDKVALMDSHRRIMGMILPAYRDAAERGQVELTTSPFYHPILPLLCDTDVARESLPHHPLPRRYQHPEDAEHQIMRAVESHGEMFGCAPRGMWPSEGSVSEAIIPLVAKAGIRWIATDEAILRHSQQLAPTPAGDHFRPYRLRRGRDELAIVFRDHRLSDRIGFVYAKWDPESAADDFVNILHRMRHTLKGSGGRPPLVNVILDGENCWEYYANDGHAFLNALYGRLSADPDLVCTTVSGHLEQFPATDELPLLFAGSWINHDFEIWIGREEDNLAWNHLQAARDALSEFALTASDQVAPDRLALAWEELYIAQGSDWCWWYGGQHAGMLEAFDALFRRHLMNIYALIGRSIPGVLQVPILRQIKEMTPTLPEVGFVTPEIDGYVGSYFEWLSAALFELSGSGGAMNTGRRTARRLFYGFDDAALYLRIDLHPNVDTDVLNDLFYTLRFLAPLEMKVVFPMVDGVSSVRQYAADNQGGWVEVPFGGRMAFHDVLEIALPFSAMGWSHGDEVHLFLQVKEQETELERWPQQGYLAVRLPDAGYGTDRWYV